MKSQLASLEIACVVKELQFLINGKIDKIFQPKKTELILQIHVPNVGKKFLRIEAGKLLYIASLKESTKTPPGFCMYLRKILGNARIKEINQFGFERIVEIKLETKDSKYSLILELFGTGNILLLKDGIILSAIEYKKWKDRDIMPKKEYSYPKLEQNFLKLKDTNLIQLLEKTEKESLVKSLAIDLGLGGIYAEEICTIAKVGKDSMPKRVKKIQELYEEIKVIRKLNLKPNIVKNGKDVVPFDLQCYANEEKEYTETYNEALDKVFTKVKQKEKQEKQDSIKNKDLVKVENIIKAQEKTVRKLQKDEEKNNLVAQVIYSNYNFIKEIVEQIKKAMKSIPHEEIKSKLKGHKIVKGVDFKEKLVELELE